MGAQRTRLRFEEIKKVVSEKQKRTVLKCYTSGVSKKTRLKKTIFKKINLFFLLFYFLLSLSFSQQDNLCIKGTLQTQTLTIKGSDTLPASPTKGEIYYKTDEDTIYFYDGSQWQKIGEGQDKTVASQIVRTQNSRYDADKTCDGTDDQQEIQQAINDLGNDKGAVYLLEGEYNLSALVRLDSQNSPNYDGISDFNKSIIGTGAGSLLKTDSQTNIIELYYSWGTKRRNLLSQFRMDGNKVGYEGIYAMYLAHSLIDNVWASKFYCIGINLGNAKKSILTSSFAEQCNSRWFSSGMGAYPWAGFSSSILANNISIRNSHGICTAKGIYSSIISFNIAGYISHIHSASMYNNIFIGNIFSLSHQQPGHCIVVGNKGGNIGLFIASFNMVSSCNVASIGFGWWWLDDHFNIIWGNIASRDTGTLIGMKRHKYGLISSNLCFCTSATIGSWRWCWRGIAITNAYGGISTGVYFVGNLIEGGPFSQQIKVEDQGTSTFYTDKLKLTLEGKPLDISNSTYTLDMTTNPRTYFQLNPQVDTTLSLQDGKSPGDLLILENTSSSYTITISESRNIELEKNTLTLGENDTLMLLWDGTKWIQTAYADN